MRVRRQMLPQQVSAIVVAVGRADDDVDVLTIRPLRVGREVPEVRRPLVVELDQHHRAVYPIIKHTVLSIPADPGEMRAVELRPHLLELNPGMAVGEVARMQGDEVQQRRAHCRILKRQRNPFQLQNIFARIDRG